MAFAAAKKRTLSRKPPAQAPKWRLRRSGGLQILEAPAFARLPWLVHGFSTCGGGISVLKSSDHGGRAAAKILNLGFTGWDAREHVTENRRRFVHAIGADKMPLATLRQIHSDIVHGVSSAAEAPFDKAPKADALITREPGVLLAVQTADCIPILLADTNTHAIAAVHSGWRGTLRRIAEKTLGRMRMEFGTRPENVIAALGPAIGRCCYEVGAEVAKEFAAQFSEARDWFNGPFDSLAAGDNDPNWLPWLTMKAPGHAPPPLRAHLDLIAANRAILTGAGVEPAKISSCGFCTFCRADLFFSYRRERTTGRLMAAIGIVRE